MKLLLDQNLSPKLAQFLSDVYPDSAHVRDFGLHSADDLAVWQFAIANDFIIVSKDSDFHQLALVKGPPPKVVWIQRGNCSTDQMHRLLHQAQAGIADFDRDENAAFLILS